MITSFIVQFRAEGSARNIEEWITVFMINRGSQQYKPKRFPSREAASKYASSRWAEGQREWRVKEVMLPPNVMVEAA